MVVYYSCSCVYVSQYNIYMRGGGSMFNKILCATELVKLDMNIIQVGVILAREFQSELIILKVFEDFMNKEEMEMLRVKVGSISSEMTELASQAKKKMKTMINSLGVDELKINYLLREGLPSHIICEESQKLNVDMIILGTSHKSAISKLFSGTTAAYVIEHSNKPVLTIPEKV